MTFDAAPGERRKQPRLRLDVPVRVGVEGQVLDGRLRDICRDAALVETNHRCPLGTAVMLTLDLPGRVPLLVAGTVIRLADGEGEGRGLAILFADLTPTAASKLDTFLATHT
jgi:PilZ domain-containing protein